MKKKTSNKVTVGPLKNSDGRLVTDDKEMADILNNHYCNMFTKEDLSSMPRVEKLYQGEEFLSYMNFTPEEVNAKLKKLRPTAAPGPD